jgi:hypothetical protein
MNTELREYDEISTTDETEGSSPLQKRTVTLTQHPGKKLKDWLNLVGILAIPLVVVLATIGFGWWQADLAHQQYSAAQQLAIDQQRETALHTYLDQMSNLLLDPTIHTHGQQGDAARTLARAKTLTVLKQLDGPRKAIVLKFLYSGNLINRQDSNSPNVDPVVNLNGADFSGVDLRGFELGGADLADVNLSGANLSNTNLRGADLSGANLIDADLSKANLNGANLSNAKLNGADLSNAVLTNVVWKNTTCPDGTNSDTNSSGSCVGH